MNKVQTISFLAIVILSAGCNEKVSPDLANASATTPDSSTTTSTSGYSFKLINKADPIYGFQLHKTGLGNADGGGVGACEIKTTSKDDKFSHKTFAPTLTSTNSARDITCYMDAEEFSLYFGGLSFEIQASTDACEFVSYSPFSYYNRMPGDSTGKYTKITCADGTTSAQVTLAFGVSPELSELIDTRNDSDAETVDDIGCNQYASSTIDKTIRNKFSISSEEKLCRFNYTDGANETCDIGTIDIDEYVVTFDEAKAEEDAEIEAVRAAKAEAISLDVGYEGAIATAPYDGTNAISEGETAFMQGTTVYTDEYKRVKEAQLSANKGLVKYISKSDIPTTKTIKCGGKPGKCIRGPIVQHIADEPRWYLNTWVAKGNPITATYSYPTLMPKRKGTFIYANFRRDLAITHNEFTETDPDYDTFISSFSPPTTVIDPKVMDLLARNRKSDGSVFKESLQIPLDELDTYNAKPLAAEAYVGIGYKNYTNPYYTFECLDKAREPMARIRMLVREWDRIFPVTEKGKPHSDLELISDIYKTDPNDRPRQDVFGTQDGGDYGDWDDWNDFLDWDDLFWPQWTSGDGDRKVGPVAKYFQHSAFPNEKDDEN